MDNSTEGFITKHELMPLLMRGLELYAPENKNTNLLSWIEGPAERVPIPIPCTGIPILKSKIEKFPILKC